MRGSTTVQVTRIFHSKNLTQSKFEQLAEIAKHLGRVRSDIWNRYGSLSGIGLSFIDIRDEWMAEKHVPSYIPARLWKATLRDVLGDIKAYREAAKEKVRQCINRTYPANNPNNDEIRKDLFTKLKYDRWMDNPYLSRLMRKYWKRGHTQVNNQIILDENSYRWFERNGQGWIAVQSFEKGKRIAIPLNSTHPVTGTLRLILRDGRVELHHLVEVQDDKPCGEATIGIDKGYTEAFTDSDGDAHGKGLGKELSQYSDELKPICQRRNKLKALARKHEKKNPKKAKRIRKYNLGRKKLNKKHKKHKARTRDIAFKAAHSLVDKAKTIAAEDLTRPITQKDKKKKDRKNYGKNQTRRLSAWVKGTLADALDNVSLRRGASVIYVNPAYTSQICPDCGIFGQRTGDRFYCPVCDKVEQADHVAARNVLARLTDGEIGRWTPYQTVKAIVQARCRQPVGTAPPGLQLHPRLDRGYQRSANHQMSMDE